MSNFQDKEKQREESRKALEEHQLREEQFRQIKEKKVKTRNKAVIIAVAVFVLLTTMIVYAVTSPGKYDDFAKCLTEKGALMQGEDWCKYTNAQKAMFGNSFKYINYQRNPNLEVRPTWTINGKVYEKVQSFERLSQLTGCKL